MVVQDVSRKNNKKSEAVFVAYHLCKNINIITLIIKNTHVKICMGHKEIHQIIEGNYF